MTGLLMHEPRINTPWLHLRELLLIVSLAQFVSASALAAWPQTFISPEDGVTALIDAMTADNQSALLALFGEPGNTLMSSGDAVADKIYLDAFLTAYQAGHKLSYPDETQAVLSIGTDEWPMPIPLVKTEQGWKFDAGRGEKEIIARRIGRNELAAMQVCLAIIEAEQEYASLVAHDSGIPEYAARFVSTPGKHDGLYWQTAEDEPLSPLGPLLAAAAGEGYTDAETKPLSPYHGYFYRILSQQGGAATGGALDYRIKGRMIGGFAVIAYPARYGVSGIMSFIVSQDRIIYEADLGPTTTAIASAVTTFNPDKGWRPAALPSAMR